jgi:transglutaminase-like putative cysteine protease
MKIQRILGLLLVVLQACVLGWLAEAWVFAATVAGTALVGTLSQSRFPMSRGKRALLFYTTIALFFLKFTVMPLDVPFRRSFVQTSLAYTISQFLLVLQTAWFFVERKPDRLPIALPGIASITMVFLADVQLDDEDRTIFQVAVLLIVVLSAAFYECNRRRAGRISRVRERWRLLAGVVVLAVACSLAWGSAVGLRRYESLIEQWVSKVVARRTSRGSIGYSPTGRIGRVGERKGCNHNHVALRVYADDVPGYLRGRVFTNYRPGQWSVTEQLQLQEPLQEIPLELPTSAESENTFANRLVPSAENWMQSEVWPSEYMSRAVFTSLGVTHVRAAIPEISTSVDGWFLADDLPPGHPYTMFRPDWQPIQQLSEKDVERLTQLPKSVDPEVGNLAAKLFEGCQTNSERINAVEDYFHANYTYRLGIQVPGDDDPLTWFLLEKPPAHCEFFAGGAAILLRLGNVPCRYVTGFVAAERNSWGGYWVARNKDAHAWVEAWDENRGWVTVEATPGQGIPTGKDQAGTWPFWESLLDRVTMLRVLIAQGALPRLVDEMLAGLVNVRGLSIVLSVLLLLLYLRRLRSRRSREAHLDDPQIIALHRLLEHMDERLRKRKLTRSAGETLHAFARRLTISGEVNGEPLADWYRSYAEVRYSGRTDQQIVGDLQSSMPLLTTK